MRFPKLPRPWRTGSGSKKSQTNARKGRRGGLPIPGRRVLAVEMAGDEIRATVVKSRGRGFEVVDFAVIHRPDERDDLPDVESLKALCERLGVSGGTGVLVSPMARAFELLMDKVKIKKLNGHQLQDAVKWEVEPYTGINGGSALIAVERTPEAKSKPGEIVYDDDDQTMVHVAAIERNVYRATKERFKVAGVRLARIYPPESCFYRALDLDGVEQPQAVLEIGRDYSNFAVLRSGVPEQISTLSLSLDSISAHLRGEVLSQDLVDTLRFTARQTPEPEFLMLTGPGATDPAVVEFVAGFAPYGARPLVLSRSAGVADARGDSANAVYATVVGAAMRELSGVRAREAGVTDSIPLGLQIRKSAYLAPVVVTGVLVLALTGHYAFMKYKEADYKGRIAEYEKELKHRKEEMSKYEGLSKELKQIEADIDQSEKRLAYMRDTADKDITRLIACLLDLGRITPGSISLEAITQSGPASFSITGTSVDPTSPGVFASAIQDMEWCDSAILGGITSGGAPAGGGGKSAAPKAVPVASGGSGFGFTLTVTLKEVAK